MSGQAPVTPEAKQALEELAKEGHVIGTSQPDANDGEIKDTPKPPKEEVKVEEEPKENPTKDIPKDDKKPERTPTMVEAWKLKVAEDQKASLEIKITELSSELDKLSKQKSPITQAQQDDIKDTIKELAKDKDVDVEFLSEFANTILKKAESKYKSSGDIENTVKKLQEEKEFEKELSMYSDEFEKDIRPLLAEFQLSGEALSQVKTTLRDYAFSETYAKIPLKEIFAIKQSELNLSVPKKSSEGKGVKVRATDVVDIDNLSEDDFSKLPPEKVLEFAQKKSSNSWQRKG